MNLLIVEDDEDKRNQLIDFVNDKLATQFIEVRSFQSGLKSIKSTPFDLILLDMTMPTFDINSSESGGRSQSFGGELLMFEMTRREIPSKVIVVTQFDLFGEGEYEINLKDLDTRLQKQFPLNYVGAVQYHISYTGWKDVLVEMIKETGLPILK